MKREHRLTKAQRDGLLIAALLVLALISYLLLIPGREVGGGVEVCVDGEMIARYSLSQAGTYPLNGGTNTLIIEDGSACIVDASCPDKLCVRQGKIHYRGQVITCLPNRLTVAVTGTDGVDLVS